MQDILYVAGAAFVLAFAGIHYWLKWTEKTDMDRQSYIYELVMAAEQLFDSDEGQRKFDYVMEQIKLRWSGFPEEIVRNLIEAAVYRIKDRAQ